MDTGRRVEFLLRGVEKRYRIINSASLLLVERTHLITISYSENQQHRENVYNIPRAPDLDQISN
jgi:hypothetical protein